MKDPGREGHDWWLFQPRFWRFMRVFSPAGIGSLTMVRAGQVGEAAVGMGVGRTPRVPERVPTLGPCPVVTLRVIFAVTVGKCVGDVGGPDDLDPAGFDRLDAVLG